MENKTYKFLLIHPEISRTKYNFAGAIENESLELEYISAMLKEKGHEVVIFDKQVDSTSTPIKIREVNPHFVYVCGRTRQENFMKEYCRDAKEFNKNIVTIVGGIHPQLSYERFYNDDIDYILITFDIFKLMDIVEYEKYKDEADLKVNRVNISEVDGICYKKNNEWIKNDAKPFDIKKLPRPDRTYFYEHLDHYRYLELLPCAHVRASYCCPYNCKFCYRNSLNCGQYIARDIEDVVDEIEEIKCDNIYFIDDDFLFDESRILRFIELIKEKNIKKKYVCYGRADFIAKNKEIMQELKNIGFYYVLVGLEAIDNNYLDTYNKKSNLNYNIESIKLLNEIGINIMGMFILDLDFEGKDFRNLYKWINKHNLKHTAVSIFTPEFGLDTYKIYEDRLITNNPEHWDYLHVVAKPSKLSVKMYYINYYILLIRLFLKGQKDGIYEFIDYGDYIKSFVKNIFYIGRKN